MADELPRPGVEVVQVFRTVSPTVITPTLVPCIVGAAHEVVDVFKRTVSGGSTLNSDALIVLGALFTAAEASGSPPAYAGLDGARLVLSINHGPLVTVLFSDPTGAGLTPATVVAQIQKSFRNVSVTAALAETLSAKTFRVRTVGVGDFQSLRVDKASSPAVLATFGIGAGRTYTGVANYRQYEIDLPRASFPAPRGNGDELAVDASSIRVFLGTGNTGSVRELRRDEAFLRRGDIDAPAVITGTNDLSTLTLPAAVEGESMEVHVTGRPPQIVTLTAAANTPEALATELNGLLGGVEASIVDNRLVLTATARGATTSLEVLVGRVSVTLGIFGRVLGANIEAFDDGDGDVFTSLLKFAGEDFTAEGTAAVVIGTRPLTELALPADLDGKTLEVSDGKPSQTVTFDAPSDVVAVLAQIDAVLSPVSGGELTPSIDSSSQLVLTSRRTGMSSIIQIFGGTALAPLGLSVGITRGTPQHVEPGDELWIDGNIFANVSAVAPGGMSDVLRIDQRVVISKSRGRSYFIVAKNLSATPATDRPHPELIVTPEATARIQHDVLRDVFGTALTSQSGRAPVYLAYSALRLDLTARAMEPGLLRIDSTTELEDMLSPISAKNPLALGLFFALANASGVQITGLGVDSVSADAPFGTAEAFARAAEFLETFEVYALAPLTHDPSVGQIFKTHVDFMSEARQKGERVVLFNSARPSHRPDKLVASGARGNSVGVTGLDFDSGVTNLLALLLAAGVNPIGVIPASAGVYLDLASDAKRYSVESVSGSKITIRTVFAAGENEDAFYASTDLKTPPLPNVLIDEPFAVRIRGTPLARDGIADRQAIAETYQTLSRGFADRRVWHTAPDKCAATIDGVEQVLPGFYMNAAIAGMVARQPPQQSFTNFPMAGFTRVLGSNDFFSERHMNIMAAGGTYIIVQDSASAPLIARHALTTDMTSVETRTDSITKVVDFTAKFLRRSNRSFIGRFNITQGFLDTLGTVNQGALGYLIENGVLIAANVNNIIQDADDPDTVLVEVIIDPPYPSNYIRVTLLI